MALALPDVPCPSASPPPLAAWRCFGGRPQQPTLAWLKRRRAVALRLIGSGSSTESTCCAKGSCRAARRAPPSPRLRVLRGRSNRRCHAYFVANEDHAQRTTIASDELKHAIERIEALLDYDVRIARWNLRLQCVARFRLDKRQIRIAGHQGARNGAADVEVLVAQAHALASARQYGLRLSAFRQLTCRRTD